MVLSGYAIENMETINTPALAVYPELVKSNIDIALTLAGNSLLRPHIKTCKTQEVVQMMIEKGIHQFKCATIAEAELLGMARAKDVLLAYQPVGTNLKRLKALTEAYPFVNYSCLIDTISVLNQIDSVFVTNPLKVFIDINVGMNRTGLAINKVEELINTAIRVKSIEIIGLHAYDGHIEDLTVDDRYSKAKYVLDQVKELKVKVEALLKKEIKCVIGGTPTFHFYAFSKENLECSPGTFIFWDAGYSKYQDLPFKPAALILTRIISIVDEQLLCLDLGHKAVASENPLQQRLLFLNIDDAILVSHSEEHLVVRVQNTAKYNIGEVWYAVPYHICPTVALHQELQVIEQGKATKEWQVVGRNRRINI